MAESAPEKSPDTKKNSDTVMFGIKVRHARFKVALLAIAALYTAQFWFFQKVWCPPQELYHRVWRITSENFFDISALKDWPAYEHKYDKEIKSADDAAKYANLILKTLDDPFTKFLNTKQVTRQADAHSGMYSGVGMIMNGKKKPVVVRMLVPGGPAQKAGVQSGDQILRVDDLDCLTCPVDRIGDYTREHMGETVTFTFRRNGVEKKIAMVPAKVAVQTLRSKILPDNVAYVRIESFVRDDLVILVANAFNRVKSADALILDLRGNPGGDVDSCLEVASMILDRGLLVELRSRLDGRDYLSQRYVLEGKHLKITNIERDNLKTAVDHLEPRQANIWGTKPVVVLVDESTASASEMLTAALKDNKRATVLGAKTFGKGVAQIYYDLPTHTCLAVTAGRYYTPAGKWLGDGRDLETENKEKSASNANKNNNADSNVDSDPARGITPDIIVKANENLEYDGDNDNQLAAALAFLRQGIKK
jgi:carboxyl-terminal processing protease